MGVLISVIIPVYNMVAYLERCFESIVLSPFPSMEIILVNDGSKDASGTMCDALAKQYPDFVSVIHQKNLGLSEARNTGLRAAKGEYIFFIDSDDYIQNDALATLATQLKKHDYPDMLGFDYRCIDEQGNTREGRVLNPSSFYTKLSIEQEPQILLLMHTAWSRVVKRSIYHENNIQFKPGVRYEDLCTTPKILSCCKTVVYIPDVLYYYLIRDGSIMHSGNIEDYNDFFPVLEELVSWFKQKNIFERYYNELVMLAVCNLLFVTSKGILTQCSFHPILDKQLYFLNDNFPNWWKSQYVKTTSRNNKIHIFLRRHRLYMLMHKIWKSRT